MMTDMPKQTVPSLPIKTMADELTLPCRESIIADLKKQFGETIDDAVLLLMADERLWAATPHSTPIWD
jgi:hypothetical protein